MTETLSRGGRLRRASEPSLWRGLAATGRVWSALYQQEAGSDEDALGFFGHLVEPCVLILATCALAWLVDRQPPFGNSMILFSSSGVAPIYLFVRLSLVASRTRVQKLPVYRDLDVVAVRCLISFLTITVAVFGLFTFLYLTQTPLAAPVEPVQALEGWVTMAVLGVGVGLVNRTMGVLFSFWDGMYPAVSRVVVHLSGVYYVVDNLPTFIRPWVCLNPLTHGVTMFRLGFYPSFPNYTYAPNYLLTWAGCAFLLGLALEVGLRDRLVEE
jgi:capsular polysaccharide transport system permease protein